MTWRVLTPNAWPCGRGNEKRVTVGGGVDGLKLHQAPVAIAAPTTSAAATGVARFQSGRSGAVVAARAGVLAGAARLRGLG